MVKVKYGARILADGDFVKWLIKNDKTYFFKLTHIKSSSIEYKKEHNLILEDDAQEIITAGMIKETNLRGAFRGIPMPKEITNVLKDKEEQLVVLGIILSTKTPFKTYLFTTKDKVGKYENSSHYKGIKSVSVKSEADALTVIDSLWRDFCSQRESGR